MGYVVTGYVVRERKRDDISKEFETIEEARVFRSTLNKELRKAISKYKWVRDLKIKKV